MTYTVEDRDDEKKATRDYHLNEFRHSFRDKRTCFFCTSKEEDSKCKFIQKKIIKSMKRGHSEANDRMCAIVTFKSDSILGRKICAKTGICASTPECFVRSHHFQMKDLLPNNGGPISDEVLPTKDDHSNKKRSLSSTISSASRYLLDEVRSPFRQVYRIDMDEKMDALQKNLFAVAGSTERDFLNLNINESSQQKTPSVPISFGPDDEAAIMSTFLETKAPNEDSIEMPPEDNSPKNNGDNNDCSGPVLSFFHAFSPRKVLKMNLIKTPQIDGQTKEIDDNRKHCNDSISPISPIFCHGDEDSIIETCGHENATGVAEEDMNACDHANDCIGSAEDDISISTNVTELVSVHGISCSTPRNSKLNVETVNLSRTNEVRPVTLSPGCDLSAAQPNLSHKFNFSPLKRKEKSLSKDFEAIKDTFLPQLTKLLTSEEKLNLANSLLDGVDLDYQSKSCFALTKKLCSKNAREGINSSIFKLGGYHFAEITKGKGETSSNSKSTNKKFSRTTLRRAKVVDEIIDFQSGGNSNEKDQIFQCLQYLSGFKIENELSQPEEEMHFLDASDSLPEDVFHDSFTGFDVDTDHTSMKMSRSSLTARAADDFISRASQLDFEAFPRLGRDGQEINLIKESKYSKRPTDDMYSAMAYKAEQLGYASEEIPKRRTGILQAVRQEVHFERGYPKPKGRPFALTKFIKDFDGYCEFDGSSEYPLRNPLHTKKRKSKIQRIMTDRPGLLLTTFRSVVKNIGDKVSYECMATAMTARLKLISPSDPDYSIKKHNFAEFFNHYKGVLKRESSKPRLTEEKKQKRVEWCAVNKALIKNPIRIAAEYLIPFSWRMCCLDEKWFYLTTGRCMRKFVPTQEGENEKEVQPPAPKVSSRRFPKKVMFLGVVARPVLNFFGRFGHNGKIYLRRVSETKKLKRTSRHTKFVNFGPTNESLRKGEWKTLVTGDESVSVLLDHIADFYNIGDETKKRLTLRYKSKKRKNMGDVYLDSDENGDEITLEGRKIRTHGGRTRDITLNDLELCVTMKRGDEVEVDCSCETEFMLRTMKEVGQAIRSKFWFIPKNVKIFLILDNAGGHGTKDAIETYRAYLLDHHNIELMHQVPNSPETNLLDLGVWRALQSIVEKLSYRDRYDESVVDFNVKRAWDQLESAIIEKVYIRWELVLTLIQLDNGGNTYVESFRGKLINEPTVSEETTDNIAEIEEKAQAMAMRAKEEAEEAIKAEGRGEGTDEVERETGDSTDDIDETVLTSIIELTEERDMGVHFDHDDIKKWNSDDDNAGIDDLDGDDDESLDSLDVEPFAASTDIVSDCIDIDMEDDTLDDSHDSLDEEPFASTDMREQAGDSTGDIDEIMSTPMIELTEMKDVGDHFDHDDIKKRKSDDDNAGTDDLDGDDDDLHDSLDVEPFASTDIVSDDTGGIDRRIMINLNDDCIDIDMGDDNLFGGSDDAQEEDSRIDADSILDVIDLDSSANNNNAGTRVISEDEMNRLNTNWTLEPVLLVYPLDMPASDLLVTVTKDMVRTISGNRVADDIQYHVPLRTIALSPHISIRQMDLDRLNPTNMLNDVIVDVWMHWLRSYLPWGNPTIFPTQVLTKLYTDGPERLYEEWGGTGCHNPFDKNIIILPFCNGVHWSLVAVFNVGSFLYDPKAGINEVPKRVPFMVHLDSIPGAHDSNALQATIHRWLNFELGVANTTLFSRDSTVLFNGRNLPIYNPSVPSQNNGYDCGIFTCRFAYALLRTFFSASKNDFSNVQINTLLSERTEFNFDSEDIDRQRKGMKVMLRNIIDGSREVPTVT